ncbi:MAG: ribosome silencing factor [Legionellales bacterium]|nr:ribosome silencing factor [Legionellales bacterium]
MQAVSLAQLAMGALEDLKALDIIQLDVGALTPVADYIIICSGRSDRHVKSIAQHLVEQLKAAGEPPLSVTGNELSHWILIDCNVVIVHIMLPEVRQYYELEKLWTVA